MNSISSSNNNQKNNSISDGQSKNNQEKNTKETKSPVGSSSSTTTNLNYAMNSIKCTRKKNNLNKVSKPQKSKNIINKELFSLECLAYNTLLKKYNFTFKKYNLLCINYLLSNKSCRLVSVFKEKMITDYIDEFLKRQYFIKESEERIPKFYLYYKHYSIFFGQPFFTDFSFNVILQKNGEKKARIYYKNHYQNGESKDEDNENIGFAESGSDDEYEDKKNNNEDANKKKKNKNNNNTIFSEGIKDNIDNITVMTTINSFENNTINLALNNEKIEIFSENKMEKSNDTTIGELMDDINKGIEEANRIKSHNFIKKKKEKNFSLCDNFYNLLKKNMNNNTINEKNKKKLIELINNNNNNIKNKLKNNSIKKKLFYVGHKNINLNNGALLSSNTQRYNTKKNNVSIKDNLNKKNISSNRNLNSNKTYKKRKLLSYTNEEVNKLITPNNNIYNPKSPRHTTNNKNINTNSNYLNTINANPVYGNKKLNDIRKITSPLQINKKLMNSINTNSLLTSLNNNHNNNKIKICKTLKSFVDHNNKNKTKKNITKNMINKNIGTISGDRKKKINKISFKKFDLDNLTETQIFREKHINKKTKGRNILSPLNNKYFENYTMTNEYTSINNVPFSANKNKNSLTNNKIFNNNAIFNNLSYQTINYEQGMCHQRTKSNLVQNNIKKNNFSKVMNTEATNAYIKPAIRIKKNDKLYMNRPILNDMNTDNNFENRNTINTNNIINSKKLSNNNNVNYLTNCVINNTNINNETKNNNNNNNNNNNIIHNNTKNTNFNKYLLEVIKKSKHQHYNSISNQVNPVHTLNSKDNKKKININNTKGNKDREVLQIALSLLLNENTSRNIQNQTNMTNILEPSNNKPNNFNTYCKINNNKTQPKHQNNNHKRNYNLNININNEININENNTIHNSTYINHTHRLNSKKLGGGGGTKNLLNNYFGDNSKQKEKNKYIINLKQKKYNIEAPLASNRNNNCQSTKNNNINDNPLININNKKVKKIKTRNNGNKNLNNALTSNNNLVKTVILNNNSVDNNKIIGNISHKNNNNNFNNKNNNIIKSYHTKSVTSLSDLMYHNKKLISLYKNLSKSK